MPRLWIPTQQPLWLHQLLILLLRSVVMHDDKVLITSQGGKKETKQAFFINDSKKKKRHQPICFFFGIITSSVENMWLGFSNGTEAFYVVFMNIKDVLKEHIAQQCLASLNQSLYEYIGGNNVFNLTHIWHVLTDVCGRLVGITVDNHTGQLLSS